MAYTNENKTRMNIYIPNFVAERIKREASNQGISINAYVTTTFVNLFNGMDASSKSGELKDAIFAMADAIKNGDPDGFDKGKEQFEQLGFML